MITPTFKMLKRRAENLRRTAQDAALALLPLGVSAYWLFTLGILGVGLMAVPLLAGSAAYAVANEMVPGSVTIHHAPLRSLPLQDKSAKRQ